MVNLYNKLPSELMNIKDPYTAYCLNECCAYIIKQLKDGYQPVFKTKYKSFKDMYRNI